LVVVSVTPASLVVPGSAAAMAAGTTAWVDKQPPVITLTGQGYVELPEMSWYTDAGATVVDNIDGSSIETRMRIQLCARPSWLPPWDPRGVPEDLVVKPSDTRGLSCSSIPLALVDTSWPTVNSTTPGGGRLYVLTYTARDAAGNVAAPLRRFVAVVPRCRVGERWCPREDPTSTGCSIQGLCSPVLAAIAASQNRSSQQAANQLLLQQQQASAAAGGSGPGVAVTSSVDRKPPRLQLLGTGKAAITPQGERSTAARRILCIWGPVSTCSCFHCCPSHCGLCNQRPHA
jgi:hypothetical protein